MAPINVLLPAPVPDGEGEELSGDPVAYYGQLRIKFYSKREENFS
jgi:hypothetical protein